MENNDEGNRYKVINITKPNNPDTDDIYSMVHPIAAVVNSGLAIAALSLLVNRLTIAAEPATIIGCLSGFGISAFGAGVSFSQIVKSIAEKTVIENTTRLEEQIAELEAKLAESEARIAELEEKKDSKPKRGR